MKAQTMALLLGYLGLVPFVGPALLIWFLDEQTSLLLSTVQIAYAALIISFMGGVQWGYAIRQGDEARFWQFLISVLPTLVLFAVFVFGLAVEPLYIAILFSLLLFVQARVDHITMPEKWFVTLRWVLTLTAIISLVIVSLRGYLDIFVG
jgi:hypothetical protein